MIAVAESWTPKWAPVWVRATYTPVIYDESHALVDEPSKIECSCDRCGAVWKGTCSSGNSRSHIQRFARLHVGCKESIDV